MPDAEDVLLALGDQRVGAAGADLGDAGLFGDFAAGHGQGGAVGADDGLDFFLFDLAFDGVGRFDLIGLVVHDEQFDFFAQDGGVFLGGELHAL